MATENNQTVGTDFSRDPASQDQHHPPTVTFKNIAADDRHSPTVTNLSGPVDEFARTLTSDGRSPDRRNSDPTSPEMPALMGLPQVKGFDVDREVGRGGMGAVYKAHERGLNRIVALKMILPERVPSAEELIRFRLEAEVAARVRHPNIVQVFESGQVDSRPFLVMEWVEGGTLSDVIKQARLFPPQVAAKLMAIIARAVHQAHLNGIVHRDLKPGNVLLARAEFLPGQSKVTSPNMGGPESITLRVNNESITVVPKVTDFGLAKLTAGDMGLTETGRVMGTPEYMAPEQAAGRIREIGPASDVHSLGVMLYQLIVGHTPFRGDSTYAVIKRVIEDEPKSIRAESEVSRVPRDLETVCMKCLRKNPFDRYQSAADFAADLEAILEDRPISARRVGPVERAWKFVKRNPGLSTLAAAFVVSVFSGLAGATWQWRRATAQRNRAVAAEAVAVANEKTAKRSQQTSDSVNRFLVNDLIATAAPDRSLGRTVTVQEALDAAAKQVDSAFAHEPTVDAGVRTALGMSYRKLGKPSKGIPHLRKAYETFLRDLGATAVETLTAGQELAESLDDIGAFDEAENLMTALLESSQSAHGPDAEVTLEIASKLGLSLQTHNKSNQALTILLETLAARQRVGSAPDTIHKLQNDLGLVHYFRQNYAESEKMTKLALEGRLKLYDPVHPKTLESRNNLAAILEARGQSETAINLLDQIVADSTRVRGANHIDTLSSLSNLGRAYYRKKQYGLAELKFQQAVDAALTSPDLGPDHPLTLTYRHNLSNALYFNRNQSKAIEILRDVIARRKRILEANHPETLTAELDLGRIFNLTQQFDQAIDTLRSNLAARATVNKLHTDEAVIAGTSLIAAARQTAMDPAIRDDLFAKVDAVWRAQLVAGKTKSPLILRMATALSLLEVSDPKRVPSAMARYAEVYGFQKELPADRYAAATEYLRFLVGQGKHAEAMAVGQDAIRFTDDVPESERPAKLRLAWLATGDAAIKANRPDIADPLYEQAYAYHRKNDPNPVELISCRYKLGQTKRLLKKFDESERHLLACHDALPKTDQIDPASKTIRTTLVIRELIQLYGDWSQPEKASEWAAKLPPAGKS
jgi:serine/threonine protein kinase/tetratricopeptide (TPR) repeat protein